MNTTVRIGREWPHETERDDDLSENPERLRDYYAKLFGAPSMDHGGFAAWELGPGVLVVVGPHDEVKGKNLQPSRLMWGLESPDVKGDVDRLKAAGVTLQRNGSTS